MRLSDRLQGLCAQSCAKTGLGKNPYNARKYGSYLRTRLPEHTPSPPTAAANKQQITLYTKSTSKPQIRLPPVANCTPSGSPSRMKNLYH